MDGNTLRLRISGWRVVAGSGLLLLSCGCGGTSSPPASANSAATTADPAAGAPAHDLSMAAASNTSAPNTTEVPTGEMVAPASMAAPPAATTTENSATIDTAMAGTAATGAATEPSPAAMTAAAGDGAALATTAPLATTPLATAPLTVAAGGPGAPAGEMAAPAGEAMAAPAGAPGAPGAPGENMAAGEKAAGGQAAEGQGAESQAKPGTVEYPIVRLMEMAKAGDYSQAESVISERAKGLAASMRADELNASRVESLKATFDGLELMSRRPAGGGVQFMLKNRQNQIVQFVVGRDGNNSEFVVRDVTLRDLPK